ncbi:hypothetical protein MB02_07085 [Croceicoccus estronivorus]|uniref:hypothetical protein n=1 Tax=Croceicoccus estronivorus TaxID=1172626 RepID=UPI00082BBEE4|nr:hypothetical protein [Croceicoccus estronivorus]OCC24343.1 hypothetical protein MB02_07085 [Croceicoccus estronivorus]
MPRPPLTLHSEAYSASGNLAADGYLKLLGAPSIDLVQTVVREAVQNSCDAALSDGGAEVHFRVRVLQSSELDALRETLLADRPRDESAAEPLEAFLTKPTPHVLEICDFGTVGLAGPTRADVAATKDEPTDFVDFLRNVGSPRNTTHGGGTYGYGKTSLYLASRCSTIVIDSQTTHAGAPRRRVIAAQLGSAFSATDADGTRRRFTGRHWWGQASGDGEYVDPVEEEEAVELADALGFPARSPEHSGTSIMILDPQFVEEDRERAVDLIEEALLWFFWPRLLEGTPENRMMHFRIFVDGEERLLPRPEDFPPLDLFARAMKGLRSDPPGGDVVRSLRPKRDLGRLNFARGLRAERVAPAGREGSLFPERSAAIAVMRPVELVVRYFTGTQIADDRFEWGGVFVASDDDTVEEAFAKAEPPAHDDWQYEALSDKAARSIVKIAVDRIRAAVLEYANPVSAPAPDGERGPSLASVAGLFGRALEGDGEGAGPRRDPPGRGGGGRTGPSVTRPAFVRLELGETGPVAVFELVVRGEGPALSLHLDPLLVMDGGTASESSTAERPTIMRVVDEHGEALAVDRTVALGGRRGRFQVSVRMPEDCAVTMTARISSDEVG